VATLTCSQAKRQSDVRFPRATVAQEQHVLTASEELASRQFQHQGLVQRWDGEEVEGVHGLDDRELRLPDATFRGPALAIQQLQFCDAQQVVLIVHLLNRALPCHLVILAQDRGQAEFLQMMFQQQLRRVGRMRRGVGCRSFGAAHAHTSTSKLM
jgi:hypothetical protein